MLFNFVLSFSLLQHQRKLLFPTEKTAPETPRLYVTMSHIRVIHAWQLVRHVRFDLACIRFGSGMCAPSNQSRHGILEAGP